MTIQNKRLLVIMLSVLLLLLIPLVAMQFTNQVNWSVADFVVAGILLSGAGLACEAVMRKVRNRKLTIAICAVVLVALSLIWAELAVGIFGTPFAGN